MAIPLARDRYGISTPLAFMILVVALLVAVGAYYGLVVPKPSAGALTAQEGDTVEVAYVGSFEATGFVFDTSSLAIARDNASWPKAVSFTWKTSWQNLTFTIGTGQVVRGFDTGVRGMALGETRTIVVPPELGYGPSDPTKVHAYPLLESVPARLTMNSTEFQARYKELPASGAVVEDPFWGWPAYVSVAGDVVVVTNSPVPGQTLRPYDAWDAVVVSIDDPANGGAGTISVQHRLSAADANRIGGKNAEGRSFVLSEVDVDTGTYVLDFNREVVGRTLVFQVTLASLTST